MKTPLSKPGTSTSGTDLIRPLRARHEDGQIVIECSDGQTVRFKVTENPVLRKASPEQLNNIECSAFGLHWPDLDEDLSLQGIARGRFGRRGGARPGAGRKPSGRVSYSTRLPGILIAWIKLEAERKGEDECVFIEGVLKKEMRIRRRVILSSRPPTRHQDAPRSPQDAPGPHASRRGNG